MVVALVLAAWLTVFLPMPNWVAKLLAFGFIALGGLFALFGAAAWYWDSHMNSNKDGLVMLVSGVLIVGSQVINLYRRLPRY